MRLRGLSAAVVPVLLLAGCGGEEATSPREGVSVQELTGDLSGLVDLDTAQVGRRISLQGQVVQVLGPAAFELRPVDGDTVRPVLVLNRHGRLQVGDVVQVAGHVRVFDRTLAQQYDLGSDTSLPVHDAQRVVEAPMVDTNIPGDGR